MCVSVSVCLSRSVTSDFLRAPEIVACQYFCPWDFPGKNTGMGCHSLFQEIFPNPGMKPMSLAYPVLGVRFFTTMYHPISVSRLGLGQSLVMEMKGHPQNSNTEWKRTAFKMGITPLHQHLYKYLANLHSTLTVLTRCFLFFCFFKQTLSAFF